MSTYVTENGDAIMQSLSYSSRSGYSLRLIIDKDLFEQLEGREGSVFSLTLTPIEKTESMPAPSKKRQVGAKALWLFERCADTDFQNFLEANDTAEATEAVKKLLNISTRLEADSPDKSVAFDMLRRQWKDYCLEHQISKWD